MSKTIRITDGVVNIGNIVLNQGAAGTSITLPAGDMIDRPDIYKAGMFRYNTLTNRPEFFNGVSWQDVSSATSPIPQSFDPNAVIANGKPGPTGPTGSQGKLGATGPRGYTGPMGPPGPAGSGSGTATTGPTGLQGPTGPAGASSAFDTTKAVTISNTTATTSTVSGALIVAGGVGVGGSIRSGGQVYAQSFVSTATGIPTITSGNDLKLAPAGSVVSTAPITLASYTLTQITNIIPAPGSIAYVSNATGGGVPVFFDGTSWRKFTDGNIVS